MRKIILLTLLATVVGLGAPVEAAGRSRGSNIQIRRIIDGSTVGRLTHVTHAPDDYTRLFILDKSGIIYIYNLKTGMMNPDPFLNITGLVNDSGNEQGLLGLAFHPDYEHNGFFYVDYINNSGVGNTEVRRFSRGADADHATTTGSQLILNITQPNTNHNGGWVNFGPNDGYLYISTGDGGSFCDPSENAQNINVLLGKMLRIDINSDDFPADGTRNYAIPPSNPFVGVAGADEIWLFGLRNPWRDSFDRQTGDLWIGDVGQDAQEEVDFAPSNTAGGLNYGWDCFEGTALSSAASSFCNDVDCTLQSTFLLPIVAYSHLNPPGGVFVCAVTGGYIYRGCAIPSEVGNYFYCDYCSNKFFSFKYDGLNVLDFQERTGDFAPNVGTIGGVTSFGEDAWGELYFCEDFGGEVYRMEPIVPRKLEDVNCDLVVNVFDLLDLLTNWGPCVGCPADINGDDVINVFDLLDLLVAWDV